MPSSYAKTIRIDVMPRAKHINLYCDYCRCISTFVLLDSSMEWICTGNALLQREGCGMRLRVQLK
jgi:hypothetical protein